MIKKILVIFLIFMMSGICYAEDIIVDDSVHNKISQKYLSKNDEELPSLPANIDDVDSIFTPNEFESVQEVNPETSSKAQDTGKTSTNKTKTSKNEYTDEAKQIINSTTEKLETQLSNTYKKYTDSDYETIKLNKGTKFHVVNSKVLSDRMRRGTKITFVSTIAETKRYVTIPKNTVFLGVIEDSHTPELTGNGGLLVIKVKKMYYKGKYYDINAKITVANDKNVFLNNIKGERRYWKNMVKSTSWGSKTFKRMWGKTKKYCKPGIEIIVTPVAFLTGSLAYCANVIASPVLAIFTKGGRLVIPQGSHFEIKLLEDVKIYK